MNYVLSHSPLSDSINRITCAVEMWHMFVSDGKKLSKILHFTGGKKTQHTVQNFGRQGRPI